MAYRTIFNGLPWTARYELASYEALVMRPAGTVAYLFGRLGVDVPAQLPDIFDGNARYYREVERVS